MTTKKVTKAPRVSAKAKIANAVKDVTTALQDLALEESHRTCSGVLTSQKSSRDIKIEGFSLSYYSQILVTEASIELNFGRRYGLIGENGCGKSTFLKALAARQVPVPDHIDIYLLSHEYGPTEQTALEAVIEDAANEVIRLEQLMEDMLSDDPDSPLLDDIYEKLDSLDPSTFESRAAHILYGLGFTQARMGLMCKDLSGGWRMRVALARALFVKPTVLLLDQPTNHLDLDFMNNVCTNIIDLTTKKKLVYYAGNYDTYVKTKSELDTNQSKAYEKQQAEIEHMKKFISSCGTYSNLVRQAKSRQKILDKMEADGLVEKVEKPAMFSFNFNGGGPGKVADAIYKNLDLGVDTESRVALVGPNGAGKSTLLKLMMGELSPINGQVTRHTHLKLSKYSQHSADQLDLNKSAVDYLRDKFPALPKELTYWRTQVGRFGLTGGNQLCPIGHLSDGLKSRIVFCEMSLANASILLLDEPTNALDIETIDSLALAVRNFEGGVVLVSHDFRLISQVADQIWLCEEGKVTPWQGSIADYKDHLRKQVAAGTVNGKNK